MRHRAIQGRRTGRIETRRFAGLLLVALASVASAQGEPPATAGAAVDFADCLISDTAKLRRLAARCTRIDRPEDPSRPDGKQVSLKVAVIPALTPTPAEDALTVLAGGPGAAATAFYVSFASAFEQVRRRRDIVLVDQRGTGDSNRLDCDFSGIDEVVDVDDEKMLDLTRACLDALPHDPRFYTTSVAVDDLDAVREALGYAQLDVYGASYGTRVALHYLRQHPEHTRTVILDGVVPMQIPIAPEIALDAQTALDRLFSRCQDDPACAERFIALQAKFSQVQATLEEGPIEVSLGDPFTGEPITLDVGIAHLRAAVRLLSYSPTAASLIPLIIEQAAQGNYQPLAAQAQMVMSSLDESLSYGMHNAVACTEDAPYFDEFISRELSLEEIERTYLGSEQHEGLATICGVWPRGVIDEGFKEAVVSDHPVLILSGEADPITPPRNGERAIGEDGAHLSNALHIIANGQGHGVAASGCLPRLIGKFVVDASHEALDTSCVERLAPTAFFLDFSATAP
ncbi:MAG: alpha/beta fold hydrolase [Pseudomonadota bacterium]